MNIADVYRAHDLVEHRRRVLGEIKAPRVNSLTMLSIVGERGGAVTSAYLDALHGTLRDIDVELNRLGVSTAEDTQEAGHWLVIGEGERAPV